MDELITEIEKFIAHSGMSEWTFGERALGDRKFLQQLRDNREPRRATVQKAQAFMANYSAPEQARAA